MKTCKKIAVAFIIAISLFLLSGCSVKAKEEDKKLFVYCAVSMQKPFDEIIAAFQKENGVKVEVTYSNTTQLITQIKASNQGDLFIPADQAELSKLEGKYDTDLTPLIKHVPIIAVPKGNPKNIKGLADFTNKGVTVILGDSKANPIGKIADEALTEAGILDKVNVKARSTAAPEMVTALSLGQCDGAIIWKENADPSGVEVVESAEMKKYIKDVSAAKLTCAANEEALDAFATFLKTDTAKNIWKKYGYEILEEQ